MGPGALRRADYRTQVVGVAELVAYHDQGGLPPVPGGAENVVHAGVLPHGGHGDDALVALGAAHAVQLAPVRLSDHDTLVPGGGGDVAQGGVGLPPGDVDFVDGRPGPEGFDNGVAALDEAVGLRLLGRAAVLVVSHGKISFVRRLRIVYHKLRPGKRGKGAFPAPIFRHRKFTPPLRRFLVFNGKMWYTAIIVSQKTGRSPASVLQRRLQEWPAQ